MDLTREVLETLARIDVKFAVLESRLARLEGIVMTAQVAESMVNRARARAAADGELAGEEQTQHTTS